MYLLTHNLLHFFAFCKQEKHYNVRYCKRKTFLENTSSEHFKIHPNLYPYNIFRIYIPIYVIRR